MHFTTGSHKRMSFFNKVTQCDNLTQSVQSKIFNISIAREWSRKRSNRIFPSQLQSMRISVDISFYTKIWARGPVHVPKMLRKKYTPLLLPDVTRACPAPFWVGQTGISGPAELQLHRATASRLARVWTENTSSCQLGALWGDWVQWRCRAIVLPLAPLLTSTVGAGVVHIWSSALSSNCTLTTSSNKWNTCVILPAFFLTIR